MEEKSKRVQESLSKLENTMESNNIRLYTDGGYSIPRMLGAWAFIVVNGNKIIKEKYRVVANSTSNQMELTAFLEALKEANRIGKPLTIYSDSQYVVKGYNSWMKGWKANNWKRGNKPLKNKEFWQEIEKYSSKVITVKWVKAHNGHKWNEYVDSLTRV